jgi:hypothetical protein
MLGARKRFLENQLNIRVHDDLLAWLVTKAEASRMHPGSYARRVLEDAAKLDLLKDRRDEDK